MSSQRQERPGNQETQGHLRVPSFTRPAGRRIKCEKSRRFSSGYSEPSSAPSSLSHSLGEFLQHEKVGTSLTSVSSVTKLRFREVKQLVRSCTAMKRRNRDSKARAPHAHRPGPVPEGPDRCPGLAFEVLLRRIWWLFPWPPLAVHFQRCKARGSERGW